MLLRSIVRRLRLPAAAAGAGAGVTALYLRDADSEFRSVSEASLPLTYEPEDIASVWSEHPRCVLSRLLTIARRVTPLAVKVLSETVLWPPTQETEQERSARHASRAIELRSCLTSLGPTFIKAGQALSIRPDLLPPAAVYELQQLCDSVPSYPTCDALRLIEAELGAPAQQLFEGLDETTEPIAAASLGQVYKCRVRDGGQEVALKVQRPDMIRQVSLDLYLLRGE